MDDDKEMEKYGVDQGTDQEKLEKMASAGCPVPGCGQTPEKKGNLLFCPTHGSEPFEKT